MSKKSEGFFLLLVKHLSFLWSNFALSCPFFSFLTAPGARIDSQRTLRGVERGQRKRKRRLERARESRTKPPNDGLFFPFSFFFFFVLSTSKKGLFTRAFLRSSSSALRSTLYVPARPAPRQQTQTSARPRRQSTAQRRRWPRSRTTNAASCSAPSSPRRRPLAGACWRSP